MSRVAANVNVVPEGVRLAERLILSFVDGPVVSLELAVRGFVLRAAVAGEQGLRCEGNQEQVAVAQPECLRDHVA